MLPKGESLGQKLFLYDIWVELFVSNLVPLFSALNRSNVMKRIKQFINRRPLYTLKFLSLFWGFRPILIFLILKQSTSIIFPIYKDLNTRSLSLIKGHCNIRYDTIVYPQILCWAIWWRQIVALFLRPFYIQTTRKKTHLI